VSPDGFAPGEVVNRRVTSHVKELLPTGGAEGTAYRFGGSRWLSPAEIPGSARTCRCELEGHVGAEGGFVIRLRREFDPDEAGGWTCRNDFERTATAGVGSLDPFEYPLRTAVTIGGRKRTDRRTVRWAAVADDPLFGGREAQAALLLAEAAANRAADGGHPGSLGGFGSLPSVVDRSGGLDTDWSQLDDLLGPDADTIAAAVEFESMETDERRRAATEKGLEFLSPEFEAECAPFEEWQDGDWAELSDAATRPPSAESWRTLPADMDPEAAADLLVEMREQLRELRENG